MGARLLRRGTMRKPAWLVVVAVLLLWAGAALPEEGPRASAPLPPPLPAAPAEAPSPRMDVGLPGQPAPEKADPPEKEFDKPKTGSPQVNSSAAPNATRAARRRTTVPQKNTPEQNTQEPGPRPS